jgi:hypothetical protein
MQLLRVLLLFLQLPKLSMSRTRPHSAHQQQQQGLRHLLR